MVWSIKRKRVKLFFLLFILCLWSCVWIDINGESNSLGNTPPVNYIPTNIKAEKEGLLGQEIHITGQDFLLDSLVFFFDEHRASGFLKNKDTLSVVVPRSLNEIESVFTIHTKSRDSLIHSSNFKLKKPTISGYSKNEVTFGESVWIYGKNFDNNRDYIQVFLNQESISPSIVSFDSIEVSIPNTIDKKELAIKAKAQLQEDSKNAGLVLKVPVITSFTSEVYIGTNGNILKGDNFNPDSRYTKILINDVLEGNIYYNNQKGALDVVIPFGPYEDFKINSISYETAGMKVRELVDTKIVSNHILYSKNFPMNFAAFRLFEFDGQMHMIAPEIEDRDTPPLNFLWKFDMETKLWVKDERIKIPAYGLNFTQIDNGVLYTYRSDDNQAIFKIDLNAHTTETIIDIPNNPNRASPVFFINNGFLYLGKGKSVSSNASYKDLYRLNLSSSVNEWETLDTDDNIFYGEKSFDYGGEQYVRTYTIGSGIIYSLYKFNPVDSSFSLVRNYSTETPHYVFINDVCYVIMRIKG